MFDKHEILTGKEFRIKCYEIFGDEEEPFISQIHWYDNSFWIVEWHTPPKQDSQKYYTMDEAGEEFQSDNLEEVERWLKSRFPNGI